jgi:hypothetical protein
MRICFTQLSGFLYQISLKKTIFVSSQGIKPIRQPGFARFYGDKFNLIVAGRFGILEYRLERQGEHRDS